MPLNVVALLSLSRLFVCLFRHFSLSLSFDSLLLVKSVYLPIHLFKYEVCCPHTDAITSVDIIFLLYALRYLNKSVSFVAELLKSKRYENS